MLKAKNNQSEHEIRFEDGITLDGAAFQWDLSKINEKTFHILKDNKSYNAELVKVDKETKTYTIKVNGKTHQIAIKDEMDILLEKMGLNNLAATKVKDLKAPMPGLIVRILVNPGDEVKKGDPLIILEAMKMENTIKAAGDGVVAAIKATKGEAVEKGHILIAFK